MSEITCTKADIGCSNTPSVNCAAPAFIIHSADQPTVPGMPPLPKLRKPGHSSFPTKSLHLPYLNSATHPELVFTGSFLMLSVSKTLDDSHCSALRKAITNVLDTDLADATFAQIIDGLPTKDVAWDRRGHRLRASHPLDDHKELCPGVVDQLHVIKAEFQINSLKFDHSVSTLSQTWNDLTILILV